MGLARYGVMALWRYGVMALWRYGVGALGRWGVGARSDYTIGRFVHCVGRVAVPWLLMPFQHHRLRVFVEATEWVIRVHELTRGLPWDWRHMADQVRRSAGSVPLNIAEGAAERGPEQCRFFRIARRSAAECESGMFVLYRAGLVGQVAMNETEQKLNTISAMLSALITRSATLHPSRRPKRPPPPDPAPTT
jgi:four helix bundle protein